MKIVYTAQPIEGMVEDKHPPVATRVAKETLTAIIEEHLVKEGLVESFSLAIDDEFPFPFEVPNLMKLDGFFGKSPDYNAATREVKELFDAPKREYAAYETNLKARLKKADDKELIAMVIEYYYTPKDTVKNHQEALQTLKQKWKSFDKLKGNLSKHDYDGLRSELAEALNVLNNCHVYGLMQKLDDASKLLKEGKRGKVKEMVMINYTDWRRKHLAPLENACGDAKFYGAGFYIARLVCPEGEVKTHDSYAPATIEEALKNFGLPFQVVQVPPETKPEAKAK